MSDIMAINRHRMGTDGIGITTLVGFYGCPLNCKYCINRSVFGLKRSSYTPQELLQRLSIDEPYFLMSGGGVTFGGGEPLLQAEFIYEACSLMPPQWKKNIETSLHQPWKSIRILRNVIDRWYVDIKEVDAQIYRRYTGKSNDLVLENLKRLIDAVGTQKVCVRYPLIPEYNSEAIREEGIAVLKSSIPDLNIERFDYIKTEAPTGVSDITFTGQ